MIISDKPLRLTCPHCGGKKHILNISSGNTLNARGWSDGRWYYPMLGMPFQYQKCPHCGHYFLYKESNPTNIPMQTSRPHITWRILSRGSSFSGSDTLSARPKVDPVVKEQENKWRKEASENRFGTLTYHELSDAHDDILSRCAAPEQEKKYYLAYIHAYNDARYGRAGVEKEAPSIEYQLRFEGYIGALTAMWHEPSTLCAEMYRELGGHYDECIDMCHKLLNTETDIVTVRKILARAETYDPDVFELKSDEIDTQFQKEQ